MSDSATGFEKQHMLRKNGNRSTGFIEIKNGEWLKTLIPNFDKPHSSEHLLKKKRKPKADTHARNISLFHIKI